MIRIMNYDSLSAIVINGGGASLANGRRSDRSSTDRCVWFVIARAQSTGVRALASRAANYERPHRF